MLQQLLDGARYELEILSGAMLTAELVARIGETSPAMICIAAVATGGQTQTRLSLQAIAGKVCPISRLPSVNEGDGGEDGDSILAVGADKIGITMIKARAGNPIVPN